MKKLEVLQSVGYIVSIMCFSITLVLSVNWILHLVISGKNIKCEHSDKKYTIEMTLINGAKTTKTYKFKSCTWFYIDTYRGSYSLERNDCASSRSSVVKNAVIDYKLIK